MQITGRKAYHKAVKITEKDLRDLHATLSESFNVVKISGNLVSGTLILFASFDELFALDNFGKQKLVTLNIKWASISGSCITLTLKEHFSSLVNYNTTILFEYQLESLDKELLFCSIFDNFEAKTRLPYWWFAKLNLLNGLFIPTIIVSFLLLVIETVDYVKTMGSLPPLTNSAPRFDTTPIYIMIGLISFVSSPISYKISEYLFPRLVFYWNKGITSFDNRKTVRTCVFQILFVTIILGVLVGLLTDWLKGCSVY